MKQPRFMLAAPSSGSGKTMIMLHRLSYLMYKEYPGSCLQQEPAEAEKHFSPVVCCRYW